MKPKKIPMRMCVGCREMKPKKELLRIVKSPTGQVAFDRIGKAPGRGAYVCRSAECLKKAVKTKALERALEFKMEDSVLSQLTEQIEAPAE